MGFRSFYLKNLAPFMVFFFGALVKLSVNQLVQPEL